MLSAVDPVGELVVAQLLALRPELAVGVEVFVASDGSAPVAAAGLVTLGPSEIRAARCLECAAQPVAARPQYLPHHIGLAARIALQAWDDGRRTYVLDRFDNALRAEADCPHRSS